MVCSPRGRSLVNMILHPVFRVCALSPRLGALPLQILSTLSVVVTGAGTEADSLSYDIFMIALFSALATEQTHTGQLAE